MQDNEEEDEDQLIIAADSDTERFSDNDMDDEQPISLESLTKKVEILTNKVIELNKANIEMEKIIEQRHIETKAELRMLCEVIASIMQNNAHNEEQLKKLEANPSVAVANNPTPIPPSIEIPVNAITNPPVVAIIKAEPTDNDHVVQEQAQLLPGKIELVNPPTELPSRASDLRKRCLNFPSFGSNVGNFPLLTEYLPYPVRQFQGQWEAQPLHPISMDNTQIPTEHLFLNKNQKRKRDEFEHFIKSSNKSKKRRGNLPEKATSYLRTWLFSHEIKPYPTEEEKAELVARTGLTLVQINNWFSNARRRILNKKDPGGNTTPTKDDQPTTSPNEPTPVVPLVTPENQTQLGSSLPSANSTESPQAQQSIAATS